VTTPRVRKRSHSTSRYAGFLELGASYTDDYVNLEGETVFLDYIPWADIDYFVMSKSGNPAAIRTMSRSAGTVR
jgi:hypothetical protein